MSHNKSKINEALEWAALYSYIYFMTKPTNPNRPHWLAEYVIMFLMFAGINMLVLVISISNRGLDSFYFGVVNVIYLILEARYLFILVCNDLGVIAIERKEIKQKAINMKIQYVDPYTPNWTRRLLVFMAFYALQFLLNDFVFSLTGSLIVIVLTVVLYGIRDLLYNDIKNNQVDSIDQNIKPTRYILKETVAEARTTKAFLKEAFKIGVIWLISFGGGTTLIFGITLDLQSHLTMHLAAALVMGLACAYGNNRKFN